MSKFTGKICIEAWITWFFPFMNIAQIYLFFYRFT